MRGNLHSSPAQVLAYFDLATVPDSKFEIISKINEKVTGTVRLSLCRGALTVTGRKSPHSLFVPPQERPTPITPQIKAVR